MDMKERLQELAEAAGKRISESEGLEKLNEVRVAYLGKKGELTAILKSMKDVAKEDRPVYFSSMNRYEVNGTAYSVGGSFGMKEKLKMIARLLIMCDESKDIIDIEDYEIPDVKVKSAAGTKKKINYFD